jgi:hypothetical protein
MIGLSVLGLAGVALLAALVLTVLGVQQITTARKPAKGPALASTTAGATVAAQASGGLVPSVHLEGAGMVPVEPGVLLNTLWEHLPNAECQSGECGGCKLRLLDGVVTWIREPVAEINRQTHILACSCEAAGPIRCAVV